MRRREKHLPLAVYDFLLPPGVLWPSYLLPSQYEPFLYKTSISQRDVFLISSSSFIHYKFTEQLYVPGAVVDPRGDRWAGTHHQVMETDKETTLTGEGQMEKMAELWVRGQGVKSFLSGRHGKACRGQVKGHWLQASHRTLKHTHLPCCCHLCTEQPCVQGCLCLAPLGDTGLWSPWQ